MNSIEHFIDGQITKGLSKKTSKVFNPATGEQSAEVKLEEEEHQGTQAAFGGETKATGKSVEKAAGPQNPFTTSNQQGPCRQFWNRGRGREG